MPRKPKKQAPQPEAAKNFDEFTDESEGVDDDVPNVEAASSLAAEKLRDWRDVERYKEELRLRRLIDDELDIDDLGEGKLRRRR